MNISIRTKLVVGFLLIFLLMVLFGVYAQVVVIDAMQGSVGRGSVFLAQSTLGSMDQKIFAKIEEIELFTKDAFLQDILAESNQAFAALPDARGLIAERDAAWTEASEDTVTPFMRELIDHRLSDVLRREFLDFWKRKYGYAVYGEAFVTNAYGANVAQTGKTSDYYQADEDWWQKAHDNGFSVTEVEYDESAKEWSIPISVRIQDSGGRFLGVIKTVPIVQQMLAETARATKRYASTEMMLLTDAGKLVYATRPFTAFEDVSSERYFERLAESSGFFVLQEQEGERLYTYARSSGFNDFRGLNWILVLTHDSDEVFARVHELGRALAVLTSVLLLLVGIFAFFVPRTIARPIQKLTQMVGIVSRGNLDVRIDITSQDEIGRLAAAFNDMAAKLKELYGNLETKVLERTRELQEHIRKLDKAAKLLVSRDLELSQTRELLQNQLKELDQVAKRLVQRDFELHQTNEMLREMDEAKSRFVSIAAHQLRTPISGIQWSTNMLLGGDFGALNPEQRAVLEEALVTINRLVKLIADLLNVARIESGQPAYKFLKLRVEDICRKVFNENLAEAKNREIAVKLVVSPDPLPSVLGDPANLSLVLQNLLENALAYTPKKGSVVMRVELDPRDRGKVRVSVQDNGMGIPEFQKNLIGQKFFRADNVVREQISGTGLGLYVVNRILAQHSGELELESEEGRGSLFTVILPAVEK